MDGLDVLITIVLKFFGGIIMIMGVTAILITPFQLGSYNPIPLLPQGDSSEVGEWLFHGFACLGLGLFCWLFPGVTIILAALLWVFMLYVTVTDNAGQSERK